MLKLNALEEHAHGTPSRIAFCSALSALESVIMGLLVARHTDDGAMFLLAARCVILASRRLLKCRHASLLLAVMSLPYWPGVSCCSVTKTNPTDKLVVTGQQPVRNLPVTSQCSGNQER